MNKIFRLFVVFILIFAFCLTACNTKEENVSETENVVETEIENTSVETEDVVSVETNIEETLEAE